MRYRRFSLTFACVVLVLLVLPACSASQRVKTETVLARVLISDAQSSQIGASMHEELQKEGMKFVTDPVVIDYVNSIAATVIPQAKRDRPGIEFRVHVVDDPEQVNAFATPGGYLYLYTGLLLTAESEAEVAGVLGHEAAHVSRLHIERGMVNAYGLQTLLAMALGNDPGQIQEIAAGIAGTGLMRAHGRSEEIEADERGVEYSSRAGYAPSGAIGFFEKLQRLSGSGGGPSFLRTHPTSAERIRNLKNHVRSRGLTGTVVNAEAHNKVKHHLSRP